MKYGTNKPLSKCPEIVLRPVVADPVPSVVLACILYIYTARRATAPPMTPSERPGARRRFCMRQEVAFIETVWQSFLREMVMSPSDQVESDTRPMKRISFIYPETSWVSSRPFKPFVKGRRSCE